MFGKLILILLLLFATGMAIPQTRERMQEAAAPYTNRFKAKLVPSRLKSIADQLEARLNRGEPYPPGWEGWLRAEYSGVEQDPWGNVYFLKTDRRGFTVGSLGPDGKPDTPDDITLTRRRGR